MTKRNKGQQSRGLNTQVQQADEATFSPENARGENPLVQSVDEAALVPELQEGDTVQTVDLESGETKSGVVTTQANGDVEVVAEDGEVLASSAFASGDEDALVEEVLAPAVEAAPVNPVVALVADYVELMGPNTAPNLEEQKRAIQILEVVFERVFGGFGPEAAKASLVPVLEFAREHKETFRSERMVRGLGAAFGHNVTRQRQMQAYVSVFANVVEKGNGARFSAGTLTTMMGEKKASEVRVTLENIIRLKMV